MPSRPGKVRKAPPPARSEQNTTEKFCSPFIRAWFRIEHQDKLSKLADLSLNTVVKIELDESPNPTIETIQRIAKALEVSVDDLLKK